jgi:hypothetical protein
MNYRITSPLTQTTQIVPERLQESDFVRWGSVTQNGNGTSHQNAKLLTPITVMRGNEEHIYPKNAYIRIYMYSDPLEQNTGTVHLISKQILP